MSTGAECVHVTDGDRHAYKIQQWPYGESPDYEVYGPFYSAEAAITHRQKNHANPGGYWDRTITVAEMDEFLKDALPMSRTSDKPTSYWYPGARRRG